MTGKCDAVAKVYAAFLAGVGETSERAAGLLPGKGPAIKSITITSTQLTGVFLCGLVCGFCLYALLLYFALP